MDEYLPFGAFVLAELFDGLLVSGVEGVQVDEVTAGPSELHRSVATRGLRRKLLHLDRSLVVAAEALEALIAATADAVGAGAWWTDRRESEERLWIRISWRLLGWRLD